MVNFQRENLEHIRRKFEAKTGVELSARANARRSWRAPLILAAALAGCLTVTALAYTLFSGLEGDALCLSSVYQGDGVVSVTVENHSDKALKFQQDLKLVRWTTGEELPATGKVAFRDTEIAPQSTGTMTIDLSGAYDLALLEQPLTGDWYYFVLTNNNFAFGQDWHCTVEFAEPAENVTAPGISPEADETILAGVAEPLRAYFETVSMEPQTRRDLTDAYVEAYTRLLSAESGTVVPSVSPVLPGNRLSCEMPCLHVADPDDGVIFDDTVPAGEQCQLVGVHWHSLDAGWKLLATEGEHALVLSAHLPQKKYPDAFTELPLFYLFTYEKAAVNDGSCAFIYGKLLSFTDLEQYKVYEDEQYVCYEVSELIYSDWEEQAEALAAQRPDTCWDARTRNRVENIYRYYKENLGGLLEYR